MMLRKVHVVTVAGLALLSLAALGGLNRPDAATDRPDCPGKIVCPQTGELICRDQCPTVDPDRPDCPGRIVCPETGELVCVDRCPLNVAEDTKPSCCSGGR